MAHNSEVHVDIPSLLFAVRLIQYMHRVSSNLLAPSQLPTNRICNLNTMQTEYRAPDECPANSSACKTLGICSTPRCPQDDHHTPSGGDKMVGSLEIKACIYDFIRHASRLMITLAALAA